MNGPAILAILVAILVPVTVSAQQLDMVPERESAGEQPAAMPAEQFDTGYRPSPTVSLRLQRAFLDRVRWSSGTEARDQLAAAFAERAPVDIWHDLVAGDGLERNNVADALTAYWVLNWVAANGAYSTRIDNAPIQRQLRIAFANDASFHRLSDQQRQELAEGYILDFLVEHAALNAAVERRDIATLQRLAASAVTRFRQKMNVDLLSVEPGPQGFSGRAPAPAPTASE